MILGLDKLVSRKTCPAPIDIIQELVTLSDEKGSASRFGSFNGVVYDTAWLSMISKVETEHKHPLFPECFNHLLESQQDSGAWGSTTSQVDGILNSLAGLLALATRQKTDKSYALESSLLDQRVERGFFAVQGLLQDWDVSQSVNVGFEILIPSLLRQLESFNFHFEFPGHVALMQLHDRKLQKFDSKLVYISKPTTLLHSLEAFVGLIDFNKVSHHCSEAAGVFASPAATAAYLIHAEAWDDRAERYLKMVVAATGKTGAVPSAYPTCLFEMSWTLSTLLAPRLLPRQLTKAEKERLGQLFRRTLDQQAGLVGFTPGVLEDADDTARAYMTLQCLGESRDPDRMIDEFQSEGHFRTYRLEGSASFSANCNVLLSLLGHNDLSSYQNHITKVVTFLLDAEASGPISDKWNLSPQYCRMLFMQTLLSILEKHDCGCLTSIPGTIIREQIPGSICRLLGQTLSGQGSDGSWSRSSEITAYSILTMAHCLSLPWTAELKGQLNNCILKGRRYLQRRYSTSDQANYLWVEKVSYRSSLLYLTYCSAALHIGITEYKWSNAVVDCFSLRNEVSKQIGSYYSSLPSFDESGPIFVDLVLIEANQLLQRLKKSRDVLFNRDDIPMTADKYVGLIPMIWVTCNHRRGHILSAKTVWEMVLLSLLNFQVDEYMESVVARITEAEVPMLVAFLRQECNKSSGRAVAAMNETRYDASSTKPRKRQRIGYNEAQRIPNEPPKSSAVAQASQVLSRFIQHVTQHWSLVQSPTSAQRELGEEIYKFLVAHIIHNQENVLLATSTPNGQKEAFEQWVLERSYFDWVRSTASDDTSCPFSFLFFASLISGQGRDCFEGARAKYFSQSLCRHLATMCRQYNDYGSAKRDAEESNLNSLDFPEFCSTTRHASHSLCTRKRWSPANSPDAQGLSAGNGSLPMTKEEHELRSSDKEVQDCIRTPAKDDLMAIAAFERSCMQIALQKLIQILPPTTIDKLQVFIDVTDVFGQIYVQKDIASRISRASR